MEFSPVFALLKKFTLGLPESVSGADTITEEEIQLVAEYMGVNLIYEDKIANIGLLNKSVQAQNRFLTLNLERNDISSFDEYQNSQFIREIVSNNRLRKKKRQT